MCAAVGHDVLELVRVAIGALALGDLAPGEWRILDARGRRRAGCRSEVASPAVAFLEESRAPCPRPAGRGRSRRAHARRGDPRRRRGHDARAGGDAPGHPPEPGAGQPRGADGHAGGGTAEGARPRGPPPGGKDGRRGHPPRRPSGPGGGGARRPRRAAHPGAQRRAVQEPQRRGEARLRPRRAHHDRARRGGGAGEDEGPPGRHRRLPLPARGGGAARRRGRRREADAEGRRLRRSEGAGDLRPAHGSDAPRGRRRLVDRPHLRVLRHVRHRGGRAQDPRRVPAHRHRSHPRRGGDRSRPCSSSCRGRSTPRTPRC